MVDPEKDTADYRRAFALAWLREPNEPFKAACEVFGTDTKSALYASTFWIRDPEVIAEKERLIAAQDEGEESFLPSKAEALRDLYEYTKSGEHKDRIAAFKLYAEVRGWMPKGGTNVNIDQSTRTTNQVMLVQDMGNDSDWEKGIAEQQRRLIENAAAPRH